MKNRGTMKLSDVLYKLSEFSIQRYTFTDATCVVRRFDADTDINRIISDLIRLGHHSRLFFNAWSADYQISVNILKNDEFQMNIYNL